VDIYHNKLFKLTNYVLFMDLFPYKNIRKVQREVINAVEDALNNRQNLLIHAPTGVGKTAAVLAPCLKFALNTNKDVFFLTSRHTQHLLAINTLKKIRERHNSDFIAIDLIGKKWMCPLNVPSLSSNDFSDFCKRQKEEGLCSFYLNTLKGSKLSFKAKKVFEYLERKKIFHIEEYLEKCKEEEVCAYELLLRFGKKARVIVADYNYVFNPIIRENFFLKTEKELRNSIIIVDEAHNLPKRCRDILSISLSSFSIKMALKEAKKHKFKEVYDKLYFLMSIIYSFAKKYKLDKNEEALIKKIDLIKKIEEEDYYEDFFEELINAGESIKENERKSYVWSIGNFLKEWLGSEEGFIRIIKKEKDNIKLSYKCLDPSFIAKEVIDNSYSVILMSGTLTPTFMYRDILGFENAIEKEFSSYFPKKNRLYLIVPKTTTKYKRRTKQEFKKIAMTCCDIANLIKGNTAFFFPSYSVRDGVLNFVDSNKKIFIEKPDMSKKEKEKLLEKFKDESKNRTKSGGILFAVSTGNFGEGIDLPGDFLKAVVVVGLPLEKPSLEIKEIIDYYNKRFGKGIEYGYIYPAMIRVLQNAGRCIRSEKDKGVIIFLDERFAWENYIKCFPKDMDFDIVNNYKERIKEFFK